MTRSSAPKRKRQRRLRGEGSITQRKDGRFVIRIELARDPLTNKRRTKTAYARTRADAVALLGTLNADAVAESTAKPDPGTVGAYFARWLREAVRPCVRSATYRWYEGAYRTHVCPYWEHLPLASIDAKHVTALYEALEANGVSARAFGQAVIWELIDRSPTDARVHAPRYTAPHVKPLTREQTDELLRAAKGEPNEALYVLAVYCGLRQGEIFALQWEDVLLEKGRGELRIKHTLTDTKGPDKLGALKTKGSRRTITLPLPVVHALTAHRKNTVSKDYVFTSSRGKPLHRSNFERRDFFPLLEKARLPRIRFHDLRHTAATMMLSIGVNAQVVAQILGHARVTMTLDVYAHVLPSMQQEAVGLINRAARNRARKVAK